jgi:hypothetical protein
MSGDYSRETFDPRRDFSGVLMQQGRVQLDADWNELVEIISRRLRAETTDIIGRCTVPAETPDGFKIEVSGGVLAIGRGRIYVDGLLAENHGKSPLEFDAVLGEQRGTLAVPYDEQPYFPNAAAIAPVPTEGGPFLVYLDVWQREVTYLEAPDLIEKAVGVDTTTRLQTVWQVRVLANVGGDVTCDTPDDHVAGWSGIIRPSDGRLSTDAVGVVSEENPCVIPPTGGYRGLENRLYRVEIHDGGASGTATFKWSRDNASIATSVTAITALDKLTVARVGRDNALRFSVGDWIEITDDFLEFAQQPGLIRQVQDVDDATQIITLNAALPAGTFPTDPQGNTDPERHTRVNHWDQKGRVTDTNNNLLVDLDASGSNGLIPVPAQGTSIILEDGVQITFNTPANGIYRVGDFWCFAARTEDASVEELIEAPPRGIHHHFCRLAIVAFPNPPTDCRHLWPPPVQAFHVTETSWLNDDLLAVQVLLNAGLQIRFDAPPDPRALNSGAFIVAIEAINRNQAIAGGAPLRDVFVLDGTMQTNTSDPTIVVWRINPALQNVLMQFQDIAPGQEPRVRVRLMGHKIWTQAGNQILYLDGQAFGEPGVRSDGTPRIDLIRPSGGGAKASDFESWFYLGIQHETEPPLRVTAVRLTTVHGEAVDITPQPSAQQPTAQIVSSLQQAQITFNRPPDPNSVNSNSVFVFVITTDPTTNTQIRIRMPASPPVVISNIVTLTLVGHGVPTGTLEVAGGVDTSFNPPTTPVTAQNDGTSLDGDYDNAPGGDFLLPFSQIIIP